MSTYGSITGHIDVALLTVYAFWLAAAGLVFYLRTEDKREGFPMISERVRGGRVSGFPPIPSPKTFLVGHGHTVKAPRPEPEEVVNARPVEPWAGAPLTPIGDPMLAGVGPGAWCMRSDEPEYMFDEHVPKIAPLRIVPGFFLPAEDSDPRGFTVVGDDDKPGGVVTDVWFDRSEIIVRYFEVDVTQAGGVGRRLVPATLVRIDGQQRRVRVNALHGHHFANIPKLKIADQVSAREEDQIMGYFGAGKLYADASRLGPLL